MPLKLRFSVIAALMAFLLQEICRLLPMPLRMIKATYNGILMKKEWKKSKKAEKKVFFIFILTGAHIASSWMKKLFQTRTWPII